MVTFNSHSMYCPLFIVIALTTKLCSSDDTCPSSELAYGNLQKMVTINNLLALNLYRSFSDGSSDNVFFSPFSISIAFGMLLYGARGQTAEELRQALGYNRIGLPDQASHASLKCLLSEISNNRDPSYALKIPNAILLDTRMFLFPAYRKGVEYLYHSLTGVADFRGNTEFVKNSVNDWVRRNTNGKVDKLLNVLNPDTAMILLNAVYFKGAWKNPFKPRNTRMRTFYNWGYEAVQVPIMRLTVNLPFVQTKEFQALEMPYAGAGNISMLIILPSALSGLPRLENFLTLQWLADVRRHLRREKVNVHLPRFSLQDSRELSTILPGLGIRKIFTKMADFSGMSPTLNVHVSRIVHKACVEVNEEGSEASAATGTKMAYRIGGPDRKFVADHPFVFAIIWNDMVLFMGRVVWIRK